MKTGLLLCAILFQLQAAAAENRQETAARDVSPITHYSERTLLKNWALSHCLGSAFAESQVRQDAYRSAGGYLEYGHAPPQAYEDIGKLTNQFLAKKYLSHTGGSLHTMACIDLFHSKELAQLVSKYGAGKVKRK